jgi:hypothetical protein
MNIYDAILRDNPFATYQFLTASASYANLMGDSNAATTASAALSNLSMVSGPGRAMQMAASTSISFPFTDRFSKPNTGLPFSIEGWFGMDGPGYFLMLTHASSTDGLYFTGDAIRFALDIDGGGQISTEWPTPDLTKNYYVAATYDSSKISLYIDGILVSQTDVPEGTVLADKANTRLYFATPAGRTARLQAPAFYYHSLTPERVAAHYLAGRQQMTAMEAAGQFGGTVWKFSDAERDLVNGQEVDWMTSGEAVGCIASDNLYPTYDDTDLSVAGTYTFSIPIADLDAVTTIQGIKLEWNGDGNFSVEYSLDDGTTWASASNGKVLPSTVGLSSLVTPMVRITFAQGRAPGLDVVRDMRFTVYQTNVAYAVNDRERTITLTGTGVAPSTSTAWSEPIDDDSASGTVFGSSTAYGYGILNESTEIDSTDIGTIEIWVSISTVVSGPYILDSRSVTPSNASYIWVDGAGLLKWAGFSAVYVNRNLVTSGSLTIIPNMTYHIIAVYSTPHNAKISLSSANSTAVNHILQFATYEGQLTQAQAQALHDSYFGLPALTILDSGNIAMTENAPAAKAYVNDWSIQGAG